MKATLDRMLIGKVVRDTYGGKDDDYSDSYLQHLIESIPFPEDDEYHDCHWRRLDDARREDKVVQSDIPLHEARARGVADAFRELAEPEIDPEEVRRALEFFDKSEWDPEDEQREMQGNVDACCAAARDWLRLREQPAPDVPPPAAQHHAAPTGPGWWWARASSDSEWSPHKITEHMWKAQMGIMPRGYCEFVPMLPPDMTEPAPVDEPEHPRHRIDALLNPDPEVELSRLKADYARRGIALEHALKTLDETQAQIDAAVERERDRWEPLYKAAEAVLAKNLGRIVVGWHELDEALRQIHARSAKGV